MQPLPSLSERFVFMSIVTAGLFRGGLVAPYRAVATDAGLRMERFPQEAHDCVRGQVGPTANLRSSSGCGVGFLTDSPCMEVQLGALRHHQTVPSGIALEVRQADGRWDCFPSRDLREV